MAATDVVTYDEALAYIGAPVAREGLEAWIEAVSDRMDELCGPIVQRTITDEEHDGGAHSLFLLQRPVATITNVTEYAGTTSTTLTAESNSSKPADGYRARMPAGIVYRRSSNADGCFARGRQNITVTYSAGRYADTDAVGARFKQAALIVLKHMWMSQKGTGNTVYSPNEDTVVVGSGWLIPRPARDLLAGEIQVRAAFA